jgi:hypothetical protein
MFSTSRTTSYVAVAIVSMVIASCVPDRSLGILVEECLETLPAVVYKHACQHGRLGPFESTSAFPDKTSALAPVNARQRTVEVAIPPRALDQDGISYLSYTPSRDGQHAIFSGADNAPVGVSLFDESEQATVSGVAIESVTDPEKCGGMVEVTGFELVQGRRYLIELGPTNAQTLRIFVEHAATFGTGWSNSCSQ